MSKVTKSEFINQFAKDGIDIGDLSADTEAILGKLGILSELTEIAGKDGKIKGTKELSKLFKVVDNFDQNGSRNSFDTTFAQVVPTPSGAINDVLKSEFNRKLTAARMNGPKTVDSNVQALPTEARVVKKGALRTDFEFGRTITQEQAASLIFKDGKIPEGTKLVQEKAGSGTWSVQTSDGDAQQGMVSHMRAHTETIDRYNPNEFWISWSDSKKVSSVSIPQDSKNEYGFKISKSYPLDAREHFVPGTGYELNFDKPMTKDQVMKTLFQNRKDVTSQDVKLIPDGKEPTQSWQLHLTATGMVKMNSDMTGIFSSANANVPQSLRPDTPPGIRTQIENHTIPNDAVAHPVGKPHPPGVYVWEQEGFLVYAVSDGKGKDGFYDAQILKLDSNKNSQFNKDMRYYMKEKGMPPYPAVAAYTKQWEELNHMMLVGFAMALSSASPAGKPSSAAFEQFEKDMMMEWRSVEKAATEEVSDVAASTTKSAESAAEGELRSATDIGNADTVPQSVPPPKKQPTDIGNADTLPAPAETVGSEPPMAQPQSRNEVNIDDVEKNYDTMKPRKLPENRKVTIKTSNGPEEMTVGEYRRRVKDAEKWVSQNSQGYSTNWKSLYQQAAEKFGLDKSWRNISNPLLH